MSGAPSAARPPTHAGYLPPKGGKLNDQIIAKGCAIEMIFFCLVLYIVSHTRNIASLLHEPVYSCHVHLFYPLVDYHGIIFA